MTAIEMFRNELECIEQFTQKSAPLITIIEACESKINEIVEKSKSIAEVDDERMEYYSARNREELMQVSIDALWEIREKIIKELEECRAYYEKEDIEDCLDSISSVEEGEVVKEDTEKIIEKMNRVLQGKN